MYRLKKSFIEIVASVTTGIACYEYLCIDENELNITRQSVTLTLRDQGLKSEVKENFIPSSIEHIHIFVCTSL